MKGHLADDRLNDHVDGLLDPATEAAVTRHLARCAECAAEVASLRHFRAATGALPRTLDPGVDLRPAIRTEAARRAAGRQRVRAGSRRERPVSPAFLATAAAAVVAVGLLTLALGRGAGGNGPASAPLASPEPEATILALDREYARAAAELEATLDAATGGLAPGTARLVRTNVDAVDRALAESRRALLEDPTSPVLRELVLAAHRQRLEVLRQAASLAADDQEAT